MKKFILILLVLLVIILGGCSTSKKIEEKNFVNEKFFYIYDVLGGKNTIVPNIELDNTYKCIHPEAFDYVYFNNEDKNIAETKEFVIEIKDFDNLKTINLTGNPIRSHRNLWDVNSWGTMVFCFHQDYGEYQYLWGKEVK